MAEAGPCEGIGLGSDMIICDREKSRSSAWLGHKVSPLPANAWSDEGQNKEREKERSAIRKKEVASDLCLYPANLVPFGQHWMRDQLRFRRDTISKEELYSGTGTLLITS